MLQGCTPWPEEFAARYRAAGYWRNETLADLVDQWAHAYGPRTAIVWGAERIRYAQLRKRVDCLAGNLLHLGLRAPERIVLQMPNIPDFVYLFYACARIGVLPVLALAPHRLTEIRYLAEFSEAVAYAAPTCHRGFDYMALARQLNTPSLRAILASGDDPPADALALTILAGQEPGTTTEELRRHRPDPADVALFLLSGGTTGLTTSGGPVTSTEVVSFTIYQRFFTEDRAGYGSAMSIAVIFIVSLLLVAALSAHKRIGPA